MHTYHHTHLSPARTEGPKTPPLQGPKTLKPQSLHLHGPKALKPHPCRDLPLLPGEAPLPAMPGDPGGPTLTLGAEPSTRPSSLCGCGPTINRVHTTDKFGPGLRPGALLPKPAASVPGVAPGVVLWPPLREAPPRLSRLRMVSQHDPYTLRMVSHAP